MENLLAMSGAREISEAALQETEGAAGILSAENLSLPARRRQHHCKQARPCRRFAVGAQLEMEPPASLQPTSDPYQDGNHVTACHAKRPSGGGVGGGFFAGRLAIGFIAGLLLLGLNAARGEETNKVQHAKLKISGFGPLGNRELKKTIRLMSGNKTPPEFYEANFVEDAALIIMSTLIREGYLAPHISAMLTLSDGQGLTFQWDKDNDTILPGPLAVKTVRFRVRRGVRFYYRHLSIQGLESLSQSEAQALFVETGFLVPLKSTRIYTPSGLERSIGDLTEALARKGFEHASVKVSHL